MPVHPYQVQVVCPTGDRSLVIYYAAGATHAHYIAKELHPGCEINVLGLMPEWEGDDPL